MAFTVTPVNPTKPGDLIHFWDVAALDADATGGWIASGFQASSGESGASVGGPVPQLAHIQAADASAAQYIGQWRVELSTATQTATVPGYTYTDINGNSQTVGSTTVSVPAGGAWRVVKGTAVGSGGTCRVGVGYFPGNLTNN